MILFRTLYLVLLPAQSGIMYKVSKLGGEIRRASGHVALPPDLHVGGRTTGEAEQGYGHFLITCLEGIMKPAIEGVADLQVSVISCIQISSTWCQLVQQQWHLGGKRNLPGPLDQP